MIGFPSSPTNKTEFPHASKISGLQVVAYETTAPGRLVAVSGVDAATAAELRTVPVSKLVRLEALLDPLPFPPPAISALLPPLDPNFNPKPLLVLLLVPLLVPLSGPFGNVADGVELDGHASDGSAGGINSMHGVAAGPG